MSRLKHYLELTKKDQTYLEESDVNSLHKFGFKINITNAVTGEKEQHFVVGDTVEEFMDNLKEVVPDLDEKSEVTIRKNLSELEKNVMN